MTFTDPQTHHVYTVTTEGELLALLAWIAQQKAAA